VGGGTAARARACMRCERRRRKGNEKKLMVMEMKETICLATIKVYRQRKWKYVLIVKRHKTEKMLRNTEKKVVV